jgi:hypothetical protein
MLADPTESVQALYGRVCDSYHAVDDFRMKLLGLLPVATGTGVFLLLSGKADLIHNSDEGLSQALGAIGIFGFLFTLGLYTYELFGIKKCHYLIETGKRLEARLGIRGQFRSRPQYVAGFLNEPFASSVIYPASMAAWLFLAVFFTSRRPWVATVVAGAVLVLGCGATLFGARRIGPKHDREALVLEFLSWEPSTKNRLCRELGIEQEVLAETVCRLKKRGEIREHDGLLELADAAASTAQSSPASRAPNASSTVSPRRPRWSVRRGHADRWGGGDQPQDSR